MGDTHSSVSEADYTQQLTYIESREDDHFQHIQIYRTKQAPYEYVMDFKKNFIEESDRTVKYMRLMHQLKTMQHKNIAKIHASQLIEENQVCIKHKKVHTFCNYYNFTLENAIDKKKIRDSFFPQSELVYIMGSLVEVACFLQKHGISYGDYRTKSIFLSPEGYVKLYLLGIEEENKHNCYYTVLAERQTIQQHILSPQQLYYLNMMEYQTKYDVYKSDLFSIAMVVLELMTFDKSKFYYNENKTQLKMQRIVFDISSFGKNYSQPFNNLMKGCLHPSPASRLTLEQANQQLSLLRKTMKNITYCIRLQDDEEYSRKNMKRQICMSVKGQHILNGLQKKLTPSPISTISGGGIKIETKTCSARTSQAGSVKM